MKKIRKKKLLDGMDRDILRNIHSSRRSLSSSQIAKKVNMSGSAIIPRLNNLKTKGILRSQNLGIRKFKRTFVKNGNKKIMNIKSPRSILWNIDMKKKKKSR